MISLENTESINPSGVSDGLPERKPYTPTPDDLKLFQRLDSMWEHARQDRERYSANWPLYLAYLMGDQLLYRDPVSNTLVRVIESERKRLWSVNNQLSVAERSFVGKLTRAWPAFKIRPGVGSIEQAQGSRVAERYIEFWMDKEDLRGKYDEACHDISWAGVGFMELYWDPMGGTKTSACLECGYSVDSLPEGAPCPYCGQAFLKEVFSGDVCARQLDAREVFLQPGIRAFRDLRWYITRQALPVSQLCELLPDFAEFLRPESDVYPDDGVQYTYNMSTGMLTSESMQEHALLFCYHEKPSALRPKGRVVYWVNDMIVADMDDPLHCLERLPLYCFPWTKTSGRLYPIAPLANAWHRQKELNENETQKREWAELIAKTKFVKPIGARLPADELTATTAQQIEVPAQYADKLRYLVPPSLPSDVFQRKAELVDDIRTMFSVTPQEFGSIPQDPNGRVAAMQEAESDQSIGDVLRSHRRELSDMVMGAVVVAQKYLPKEYKFSMMDEDGYEVYSFQDMNLLPGFSMRIEAEDGLSNNQALRFNESISMAQIGAFMDPATGQLDMGKFAKVARLKVPGLVPDATSTEYAAAMAAIKRIEDGQGANIMPSMEDDPQIFANTILSWLRGKGRQHRDSGDPMGLAIYQQVTMLWQQYLMILQGAMAPPPGGAPQGQSSAMAGGSPEGGAMSAPGGTPNNVAPEPGSGPANAAAAAELGNADAAANSAVRSQRAHES